MFVGQQAAQAGNLINESFEASPSAIFGDFQTYAYSQNYTGTSIPPGAGLSYYTAGSVPTNSKGTTVGLTGANGVPFSAIDAGQGRYNLSTWFSSYAAGARDWSQLAVQFQDGGNNNLGPAIVLGGKAFVDALSSDPSAIQANGEPGVNWGQSSSAGTIPVGARNAVVTLFSMREDGNSLDGYVDLVQLDVSQVVVPEPMGAALLVLGPAGAFAVRRRRGRGAPA
jgi:hypothetical protein